MHAYAEQLIDLDLIQENEGRVYEASANDGNLIFRLCKSDDSCKISVKLFRMTPLRCMAYVLDDSTHMHIFKENGEYFFKSDITSLELPKGIYEFSAYRDGIKIVQHIVTVNY